MLHLYFLSVGPVLDPVVTGCCSSPPSWLLWLSFDRLRSNGLVVGPVAPGAVVVRGSWLWLSFDRLQGCRSRGSVAVVQMTPVAVVPVAPVVSIDSRGWRLITRWLSFDHSSSCCLIESGGCRSSSSSAVDRSGGGCRSISPVVAVVRSLRWWLSFDRSGGGCRLMDYGGCGSITPVAVKLLSQWLRGLSIRWLQ